MSLKTEERHESLYFADGDIVLSAPKSASLVQLFRVDKIFLRRHSAVFNTMLSLPGDASTNDTYDGVPRVDLSDNADDMAGLLGAIYNPASLPLKPSSPHTPVLVYGIMKVAVKYEVETVQTMIRRQLRADWPLTLAEWDDQKEEQMADEKDWDTSFAKDEPESSVDDRFPEPASAIRFAIDFDCPEILPAAFYQLAQTPPSSDWNKLRDSDTGLSRAASSASRSARWTLLRSGELMTLLNGISQLERETSYILELYMDPEDYFGFEDDKCSTEMEQIVKELLSLPSGSYTFNAIDPLQFLKALHRTITERIPERHTCDCSTLIKTEIHDRAEHLWHQVERAFKLIV